MRTASISDLDDYNVDYSYMPTRGLDYNVDYDYVSTRDPDVDNNLWLACVIQSVTMHKTSCIVKFLREEYCSIVQ